VVRKPTEQPPQKPGQQAPENPPPAAEPQAKRGEQQFRPARRNRGEGKYNHVDIRNQILRDKDFAMEQMLLM
jgi:hypothetical protein